MAASQRRPAPDRLDPAEARAFGLDPRVPGEVGPLEYRRGRPAITEAEARAVYRRQHVVRQLRGVRDGAVGAQVTAPADLPDAEAVREMIALRFPPVTLAYARARAEVEGLTLTAVLEAALVAYGEGRPGEPVGFLVQPAAAE